MRSAGGLQLPILIALLQWADRWLQTPRSIPMCQFEHELRAIASVLDRSHSNKRQRLIAPESRLG